MTVSSTSNRKETLGDAISTSFSTSPVVFFDSSDLQVYVVITATGASTLLTQNTHYTVTGGSGATGIVDFTGGSTPYGAPAATITVIILRVLPLTQEDDLVNNDGSDAEVLEDSLDKLIMIEQQQDDRIARSLVLADSDVTGADTTLPTPAASMLLGWNALGTALANYTSIPLSGSSVTAFALTLLDDATALAARATLGQNIQILWGGTTGGTANAQSLAPTPTAETLAAGTVFLFKASLTNTGAATLTIGAQAAKAIQNGGSALAGGEIVINRWYAAMYDGAAFQLQEIGRKAVGTAGYSIISDSSALDKLRYANVNRGVISGLVPSVVTTASNSVSVGVAMDSTGVDLLELTSAITKSISGTWVVGSVQNGLDTGTVAPSTWYYVWLIKRVDTGVVDVLYSVSATAPTMPTNYTLKRLIGALHTDGSSIFEAYHAYELAGGGLELLWDVPTLDINLSNTLTTARRADAVKTPALFSTIARLNAVAFDATTAGRSWVYCPDQSDTAPSATAAPLANLSWSSITVRQPVELRIRTGATGLVAARADLAVVDSYLVSTMGFEWSRQ